MFPSLVKPTFSVDRRGRNFPAYRGLPQRRSTQTEPSKNSSSPTRSCPKTPVSEKWCPSLIDTGGERFGFFLPFIDVARGQTAHFNSVGIYETFSGPNSVPHRPSTWRCIEMTGTAQSVIVPL